MVNQSFSGENFRRFFDYENRRGVNLAARYFPEVDKLTQEIKACMIRIRDLIRNRGALSQEQFKEQQTQLNQEKIELNEKKESLLTKELEKVAASIATGNLQVGLKKVQVPGSKDVYAAAKASVSYFVIKQILYNIWQLYKVKQSNRYEIIRQLKGILEDSFPKYVIRTDIKDFYESIPHDKLLKKLNEEALLLLPSRRVIAEILREYRTLAGSTRGIPRGIGFSAYLAELYMREFDRAIEANDEVIFYARYVDDIVVVFAPRPNSLVDRFLPSIERRASELGLALNLDPDKTSQHDLKTPQKCVLNYLGYRITFGNAPVRIGLNDERKKKYKNRLKCSFDSYKRRAQFDERRARRILIKRIKYLTGNTHLLNNKNNVMTGVFYSNSNLTSEKELEVLDLSLSSHIDSLANGTLKGRLKKYSFQEGFSQRRYHVFSPRELSQIVEIWKHEA